MKQAYNKVDITRKPHDQLVPLVEATIFGTEGLRYRRLSVQSQLDRFCQPTYFHAMRDGDLLGVYVLDKRNLLINGSSVQGFYRGILAVDPTHQAMGVGKALTRTAMQWLADEAKGQAVVSYGCIDKSNKRSLSLLQSAGASVGASLSMYMMYRQWPSAACTLEPLTAALMDNVRSLADEVHADCQVRDVSVSGIPGWVLQDASGIAISARTCMTSFQISTMGNLATWSTRCLVKPFAPARKRFDPDCFRYVSFSDVLIRPGCENLWQRFVSTVLAQNQCHFGAVFVDPNTQWFVRLQRARLWSRLLPSSSGSISVVWQTMPDVDGRDITLPKTSGGVHLWPVDA